jgi:hypothetical protein
MQGCPVTVVSGIHIRAVLQEKPNNVPTLLLRRKMQE